jgi:tetraacyldisaccharide 4'-kinase
MNFNFPLLGTLRMLLFPFSILYYAVIWVRNLLYDKKLLRSTSFNLPLICVGNLSVGGTGKSPMVEYLIRLLKDRWAVATLSRGYKRKTRGYALANEQTTALEIGDEPMLFHSKFPEISVSVGEARIEAIPQLLHDKPDTQVVILDDAFQHRSINPNLNILLVDYNNLFTRDWYLPTGNLRDEKRSRYRASVIVITKCDPAITDEERRSIIREIEPAENQQVFFSCISYGTPYHVLNGDKLPLTKELSVLLISGIANPLPLKQYLDEAVNDYDELLFQDHQIFTIDDMKKIVSRFEALEGSDKIIITTEKDAVRLIKFENFMLDLPVFSLPIEHRFLFNEGPKFDILIEKSIQQFNYPY